MNNLEKLTSVMEKAEKNTTARWMKYVHDFTLFAFFMIVVLTAGLYGMEYSHDVSRYIHVSAVVADKAEVEGDAPIRFIPLLSSPAGLKEIEVITLLRCDAGGDGGFEYVGETETALNIQTFNLSDDQILPAELYIEKSEHASTNGISAWLRSYAKKNNISAWEYSSPLPPATSSCFGDHTFVAKTPIFKIPKILTIKTYPFDYVWYGEW